MAEAIPETGFPEFISHRMPEAPTMPTCKLLPQQVLIKKKGVASNYYDMEITAFLYQSASDYLPQITKSNTETRR